MGRSYRRPYSAITGTHSAKKDKREAARGVRHKLNQLLRTTVDLESLLLPHKRECHHNNVYDWSRDGRQRYQRLGCSWSEYCRLEQGLFQYPSEVRWAEDQQWPPKWYVRLKRK